MEVSQSIDRATMERDTNLSFFALEKPTRRSHYARLCTIVSRPSNSLARSLAHTITHNSLTRSLTRLTHSLIYSAGSLSHRSFIAHSLRTISTQARTSGAKSARSLSSSPAPRSSCFPWLAWPQHTPACLPCWWTPALMAAAALPTLSLQAWGTFQ
jgi:hypothetical protein